MQKTIEVTLSHELVDPAIEFSKVGMELNSLEALYGSTPQITSIVLDERKKNLVVTAKIKNVNNIELELDGETGGIGLRSGRMRPDQLQVDGHGGDHQGERKDCDLGAGLPDTDHLDLWFDAMRRRRRVARRQRQSWCR